MLGRYVAGTSPVLTVTKWHDLETGEIDNRYTLEELTKKFQEVVLEI